MVDPSTRAAYETHATDWARRRRSTDPGPAARLLARLGGGSATSPPTPLRLADLGCGPGFHLRHLGAGALGLDASRAMLDLATHEAPDAVLVHADIAELPLADRSLDGVVASKVLVHVDRRHLPMALAELHRVTAVDAPVELVMWEGDQDFGPLPGDPLGTRRYALWDADHLVDVIVGAGFAVEALARVPDGEGVRLDLSLRRLRTLADTVGPDMRVLVCGLNPSLYAADAGVGFARPGNRFWPAALAAGLVTADRDPRGALRRDAVGMTDLVKRATVRADELTPDDYHAGLARLERLCAWLRPSLVCMVGLSGWRAAVDRGAVAGLQTRRLGGRPVYVMGSTSGLNAHSRPADHVAHLRRVAELADRID
ncbi:MAG: methyltransferase domain-containing protein [Actinomyces sp.]|nr:MAG: methyltransferase domain-containing protein [Actinomyces sp.]